LYVFEAPTDIPRIPWSKKKKKIIKVKKRKFERESKGVKPLTGFVFAQNERYNYHVR